MTKSESREPRVPSRPTTADRRPPARHDRPRSTVHGPRSARRAAAGFTLLELVVVVGIVSVVFALALPALGDGLRRWRLQGTVREVATILKFARNQSVAGRASVQVVLDRSRNVYWLDRPENGLQSTLDEVIEKGIRLYAMPAGIRLGEVTVAGSDPGAERVGILFFPRGSSTGAEVEVRDEKGRAYRIHVDSMTGRARIVR